MKRAKKPPEPPGTTYFRFTDNRGRVSIRRKGIQRSLRQNSYHWLLGLHWSQLIVVVTLFYLFVNIVFALLYLAGGDSIINARPGNLADAFFFSVETLATIGYGTMAPRTTYGNIIMTAETVVGALTLATVAGIFFNHYSRPTASLRFTKKVVIAQQDGIPTLMFRIANRRSNRILQAEASVTLARRETTLEGESMRRLYDLELVRDHTPFLSLTWTVMHRIDERSPLYGQTPESLMAAEAEIGVLLSGTDDIFGQVVHSRHGYGGNDIVFGSRFEDIFKTDAKDNRYIDYTAFDAIRPDGLAPESGNNVEPGVSSRTAG